MEANLKVDEILGTENATADEFLKAVEEFQQ